MRNALRSATLTVGLAAAAMVMTSTNAQAANFGCTPTVVTGLGFSVTMPCRPNFETVKPSIDRIGGASYTASSATRDYTFAYGDYNKDINDFSDFRDNIKGQVVRVLADQSVKINGTPGWAISAVRADGTRALYYSFIRGRRMFVLVAYNTGENPYPTEVTDFVFSLRIW